VVNKQRVYELLKLVSKLKCSGIVNLATC